MGVKPLDEDEIPGSEKRTFLFEIVLGVLAGIGEEGMLSHDGSGLMMLRRERLTAMGRLRSSMMS